MIRWSIWACGGRRRHLAQLPLASAPGRAVSRHQRGRAGRVSEPGAAGRAEPGPVRQAAAVPASGDFPAQLGNFWQYFSWQFARDWGRLGGAATGLFTVLGLTGLWELWKRDRRAGHCRLALLATLSVGLVFYMNFKYGYSQYPGEPSLPREVRERDYFFLGSFAVYGAFVALGSAR